MTTDATNARALDDAPFDDFAAAGAAQLFRDAPNSYEFQKLRKRLARLTRQAIDDFAMVDPRDRGEGRRWLVCLSGGKDSYGLLAMLLELKWRGVLKADLLACNLDQGQPGFPKHILPDYLTRVGAPHRIEYADTYSVVMDKVPENKTYCSLCSRLRRGNLYRIAREEGCDAVVLGHHRDDILETFFLNLFFGGRIGSMPPKLLNDDGDLLVLRPLAYCEERDLETFARKMQFPIIPCDLCGSQDGLQRQVVKRMLTQWETESPGRRSVMFRALCNTRPSHLLDRRIFDFAGVAPQIADLAASEPASTAAARDDAS